MSKICKIFKWCWCACGWGGGSSVSSLSDLNDVQITDLQDGQVIAYNGATDKFQNVTMYGSDVAFATVQFTGQTATFSSSFITAETFVSYLVKTWTPVGTITITVANGSVTIDSTDTEDLTFLLKFEKVNSESLILF